MGSFSTFRAVLPLLRNYGLAFDTRAAVRKTVAEGNVAVMKSLFEARVDVGFQREDYPLADCIARGHQELAQVLPLIHQSQQRTCGARWDYFQ